MLELLSGGSGTIPCGLVLAKELRCGCVEYVQPMYNYEHVRSLHVAGVASHLLLHQSLCHASVNVFRWAVLIVHKCIFLEAFLHIPNAWRLRRK